MVGVAGTRRHDECRRSTAPPCPSPHLASPQPLQPPQPTDITTPLPPGTSTWPQSRRLRCACSSGRTCADGAMYGKALEQQAVPAGLPQAGAARRSTAAFDAALQHHCSSSIPVGHWVVSVGVEHDDGKRQQVGAVSCAGMGGEAAVVSTAKSIRRSLALRTTHVSNRPGRSGHAPVRKAAGLSAQYRSANFSMMRSIFWASPGSLQDAQNKRRKGHRK